MIRRKVSESWNTLPNFNPVTCHMIIFFQNESTTDAGPFVVIYDGEKAHCFRPLEKIQKFIVEKAKVTKNNPKNGVQSRGNRGGTK